MKSLLIERVQNGWIVRPFTPGQCDWARGDETQMFVFNDMAKLIEALPQLMTPAVNPTYPPHTFPPSKLPDLPFTKTDPAEEWHGTPREFP